jgi:hypothetical protein
MADSSIVDGIGGFVPSSSSAEERCKFLLIKELDQLADTVCTLKAAQTDGHGE